MTRTVVAMSGGVDSAVAAALLAERGDEVVGVWLRLVPGGGDLTAPRCCGTDGAGELARRAAAAIGIPFYALDYAEVFGHAVVDRFVAAYAAGETPNPCVACNAHVKFEPLLRDTLAVFGADRLATGHYARVASGPDGRWRLLRARDAAKDQSYALYMLGPAELARLVLPIGELATKDETRVIASRLGLPNAGTPESQDICFVGGDYRELVRERAPEAFRDGPVEREDGTRVGSHRGVGGLTVGQRSGVGAATGERLYVLRLELERNAAVVGPRSAVRRTRYALKDASFVAGAAPAGRFAASAVLRYRGEPIPAQIEARGERVTVELASPALVAPGQALVLYDGEEVLGGGTVRRE